MELFNSKEIKAVDSREKRLTQEIEVVTPEKQAIRDILKALNIFKPAILNAKTGNTLEIVAQVPKFIKVVKANKEELKTVFSAEFLKNLETLAK